MTSWHLFFLDWLSVAGHGSIASCGDDELRAAGLAHVSLSGLVCQLNPPSCSYEVIIALGVASVNYADTASDKDSLCLE